MSLAPVALFTYNRPDHTRRTLEHLIRCRGFERTPVWVFCDAPRTPEDSDAVTRTRRVTRELLGERAHYVDAETNLGLARSIIRGVTRVCEAHGRVIVLEDDLLVDPGFLAYMNEGLERYENEARVMQVAGYQYPIEGFAARRRALVLPFITTWGWATWARAWKAFDPEARGWEALRDDRALRRRFDVAGVGQFSDMLIWQMEGQSDAWGSRWYWSVFREHGVAIWPPQSLVKNIGYDGSGRHGWRMAAWVSKRASSPAPVRDIEWPEDLRVRTEDLDPVLAQLRRLNGGFLSPVVKALRRLRHRIRPQPDGAR